MDTYTIFELICGGDKKWRDNSLVVWGMEGILSTTTIINSITDTVVNLKMNKTLELCLRGFNLSKRIKILHFKKKLQKKRRLYVNEFS
jgi:hypothetical protein